MMEHSPSKSREMVEVDGGRRGHRDEPCELTPKNQPPLKAPVQGDEAGPEPYLPLTESWHRTKPAGRWMPSSNLHKAHACSQWPSTGEAVRR